MTKTFLHYSGCLPALCAALSGCTLPASIGRIVHETAPGDAALEAGDSAPDGAPDGAVLDADASDGATADTTDVADAAAATTELTGLDSNAPVLNADSDEPTSHYRIYYRGRDGTLWMERRDAETHVRGCAVSLGAPSDPDLSLAGQPAVAAPVDLLVVPARRRSTGALELWSIEQWDGVGDACGHRFSGWSQVALPDPPSTLATAPGMSTVALDSGGDAWMAIATTDGFVMYNNRGVAAGAAWGRWRTMSRFASGERPVARPTVTEQLYAGAVQVWIVVERPSGAHAIRSNIFGANTDHDLGYWLTLEAADDPPATALAVIDDASIGLWVSYWGRSGHAWATVFTKISPGQVNWTEWRDLHPAGSRPVGMPAIGMRRSWRAAHTDALLVSAPLGDPRELRFSMVLGGLWTTQTESLWPAAAGELQ